MAMDHVDLDIHYADGDQPLHCDKEMNSDDGNSLLEDVYQYATSNNKAQG